MIISHNWDVCPDWVTFSPDSRYWYKNAPFEDIRRHGHNWDVCPGWVRFSLYRREKRRNKSVVEEIREDDKRDKEKHRQEEVTGEAIPLPNGNHFHRVYPRSDVFDDEREETKTGPAIWVGRRQHIHIVKRKHH